MIYSVLQHKEVPVTITKEAQYIDNKLPDVMIRYNVYDASPESTYIGFVDLLDAKNGIKVSYIKNQEPDLYRHFGQVADQIEVEHCLKRGIDKPYIHSVAALGTHIKHFKRGKRFIEEGINIYFNDLVKHLQKGEHVMSEIAGYHKMYMPMNLVNEIKEKIKINPLLKGIK